MAAETEIGRMVVRIRGDTAQYQKSLKRAGTATQKFSSNVKKFMGIAAGAIAALGAGKALRDMFQAFVTQETAVLRLNAILEVNGREVKKLSEDYQSFATEMQGITVVGDETTIAMLQQAESLGITGESAKRAVKNALGLSAALGMSAQSALRYSAVLEQGDTTMLNRYLPSLRGIEDQSQRVAEAQRLLGNMFSVARAEAQSSGGQIQQLKNSFGDFMEELGSVVADGIRPVVVWLKQAVEWFQSLSPGIKSAIVVALGLVTAIGVLIPVFIALKVIIAAIGTIVALVFSPVGIVIAVIAAAIAIWVVHMGGLEKAWKAVMTFIQPVIDAVIIGIEAIAFGFNNFSKVAKFTFLAVGLELEKFAGNFAHFFSVVLPTLGRFFLNNWQKIFAAMGRIAVRMITSIPDLISGRTTFQAISREIAREFNSAFEGLVIPERVISERERNLTNEVRRQARELARLWEARNKTKKDANDEEERNNRNQENEQRRHLNAMRNTINATARFGAEAQARIDAFLQRRGGIGGLSEEQKREIKRQWQLQNKQALDPGVRRGMQLGQELDRQIAKLRQEEEARIRAEIDPNREINRLVMNRFMREQQRREGRDRLEMFEQLEGNFNRPENQQRREERRQERGIPPPAPEELQFEREFNLAIWQQMLDELRGINRNRNINIREADLR